MSEMAILERLFSVKGKTAVVTGGSRGIGRMIAEGLVEAGATTYISARNADECQRTAEELGRHGTCVALPFDLSGVDAIGRFAAALGEREKALHILVNNAGTAWGAPLADYPEHGWDKVASLNLKSPFFLIQQLLPLLLRAGTAEDPARVINIASINGMTNPHVNNYAYSAAKAAVIHLTRHLAADLAGSAINVNAIAPGYFMTKMMAYADEAEVVSRIPRGRAGQPDDAAGAALFLSSAASSFITGVTIPVDGGVVANA